MRISIHQLAPQINAGAFVIELWWASGYVMFLLEQGDDVIEKWRTSRHLSIASELEIPEIPATHTE
jgi:hypothetical protein